MAFPTHRDAPCQHLVMLLRQEKDRLLGQRGGVTAHDFDEAWDRCLLAMRHQDAWPTNNEVRKRWREALVETRPEIRAAFLDLPTPFMRAHRVLLEAMAEPREVGPGSLLVA